ncbi:MAG: hypothetical protein HGB22_03790 [Chlorobiaceae bacterium]|nr:hypothetical protein [Chlorobiaceae bacterium]
MNDNVAEAQKVVVTDVRMPFSSMVVFMIKWALASIPALLMLWLVFAILLTILMFVFGEMWGFHSISHQLPTF